MVSSSPALAPSRAQPPTSLPQSPALDESITSDVVIKLGLHPPAFEMLVIGCGGGPLETNLSSYLIKPYHASWQDGCTSLEGGSTIGALARLIEDSPQSFVGFGLGIGVDESDKLDARGRRRKKVMVGPGREGGGRAAGKVWDMVKCFAISHAHLDHIQGLIISSGASMVGPRPLYGTRRTLDNLDGVFSGGPWPRLVGPESDGITLGRAYLYRDVKAPSPDSHQLSTSLEFTAFPLAHGMDPSHFHKHKTPSRKPARPPLDKPPSNGKITTAMACDGDGAEGDAEEHTSTPPSPEHHDAHSEEEGEGEEEECYDSTAFFVKESVTGEGREMLFFGDVEPDSISKRPLNLAVWKTAAPKIASEKLCAIFLECSYPTSQPTDKLWGHLSPPFVAEELRVLAREVVKAKVALGVAQEEAEKLPLKGVAVVIIHIKDDILPLPSSNSRPPTPSSASFPTSATAASAADGLKSPTAATSSSEGTKPPMLSPAAERVRSASHYALSMSPPLPSVPLRRASGSGTPLWSIHSSALGGGGGGGGVGSGAGGVLSALCSAPLADGSAGAGAPAPVFWGRRASMPWNIHPSFGAPRGATNLGVSFGAPFAPGPLTGHALPQRGGRGGFGPSLTITGSGSASVGAPSPKESIPEEGSEDEEGEEESEEEMEEETVHERIERELNALEDEMRTGVRFIRAEQGMRLAF